jgi:hypothetical protein
MLAGTVLGLSAYFASIFLPGSNGGFLSILRCGNFVAEAAVGLAFSMIGAYTIYAVVVSSVTILALMAFLTS